MAGNLAAQYKEVFTRQNTRSFIVACIILCLAIIFQFYASAYADRVASTAVNDLLLDNLPIIDLNNIIVEGVLAAIVGSVVLLFLKPRYLVFTVKAAAIFIATRAVCISLTHLGIYPGQVNPDTGFFDRIYTDLGLQAGFFFSGHTGLPFLLALIFWNEKFWRYLYFLLSLIFGVAVILAHVHYSIDVFAAPYIAYGIFKQSQYLFERDYRLIVSDA
ncbi:MAG: hypothetical protein KGI59_01025 [Patescibacteria group bacterium]|nr:hypothetical protein [Patescibacteria group bacterium]MDE2172816.1 hypothetical protein [Patescibacteria group bacterium]